MLYIGIDMGLFHAPGASWSPVAFPLAFSSEHSQTRTTGISSGLFPLCTFFLAIKSGPTSLSREWSGIFVVMGPLILADLALRHLDTEFSSFHPSILPLLLIIILRTNFLYYNLNIFNRFGKST